MPWWGWMVIGCFLLGAELLGVDAAFYLVFIGFAAILTGLLELGGLGLPEWAQWLVFSVLTIASMVFFRARVYKKLRGGVEGYDAGLSGELVDVSEPISPGHRSRVELRGSVWTAVNVGQERIEAGQVGRVVESDGTVLKVVAITESNEGGS